MKTPNSCFIVMLQVLVLVALLQVLFGEGLEPNKHTSQACFGGFLNQVAAQDGSHGRRTLEYAIHPFHALEQ